jgi:glucose/arabinose dehydrogenase
VLLAGVLWLRGLPPGGPDLDAIRLPEGFRIVPFADSVPGARALARGARGTVFVGTRSGAVVYALTDPDGDGRADSVYRLGGAFDAPNGVAFKDGALFVADIGRLWRFDSIEDRLASPPDPALVTAALPREGWHGLRFIAFGPDGLLYIGSGAPCNVCLRDDERLGTILRLDVAGGEPEIYARGVRNTLGFDWHPATGELWFTDNGRDWMGANAPPDELNRATGAGQHFGFPFCHGGELGDPEFTARSCAEFVPPAVRLDAHVAPLGMRFYRGALFPPSYRDRVFIAEHGSWNRLVPVGYRVTTVRLEGGEPRYEVFASGWLRRARRSAWGRPVDVLVTEDGALLVSDDHAGAVYRISYGR